MKPTLGLKLSQSLTLTPQLQQSIKLLQMSTLELNEEIDRALDDNPLLERLDDPQSAMSISVSGSGRLLEGGPAPMSEVKPGSESATDAPMAGESDTRGDAGDAPGADLWGADSAAMSWGNPGAPEDDDREGQQLSDLGGGLREHLLEQLAATRVGASDRVLAAVIIDALDDNGYLLDEPEELVDAACSLLGDVDQLEVLDDFPAALKLVQSFDPPGVGARSAAECLALQILHCDARSPLRKQDRKLVQLALHLVRNHLQAVASRDFTRLRRLLRVDDEALRSAVSIIKTLDPHPGSRWASSAASHVVPDVRVVKTREGWQAQLNSSVMPKLAINEAYARVLKEQRGKLGEGGAALSARLQEARWMIKNVEQRFDTILRVSQAIVERQKAFFTHGEVAMRPLVLREIADILGLHESTISRVTTQKFMATPFGTFELKYFFGSSLATEAGGTASSTAIRALIKQLIAAENTNEPLSDSRIAELLAEQGVVVARRTVAKYREAMKIAPVNLRKHL